VIRPHINVPFHLLDKHLKFLKDEKLDLEIYFNSGVLDNISNDDITGIKRKLDYNPRLSIHSPFMDLSPGAVDRKVRDVTKERFSLVLDFAEILCPETIVFHSGYDKWRYDGRVDIWLEGSLDTWKPVQKRASDLGIRIAIENVFETEPSHLKLLMEEMGSGNFGLCFDTGHFNLFSEIELPEWLRIVKPYVIELHLHDNFRTADDHLAIGDGNFDFITLLNEFYGHDCIYTIESHTVEGVKKSIEWFRTFLP
jgi:sugar phosphate isomerase/epimerase